MIETTKSGTSRQQILKDSAHYLTSNIVTQAFGLLRAFLLPVLLGPAQLGIWNLMNVIISYGANAHLGILHGFNKKMPALRALGHEKGINELKDSIFWTNLLMGLIVGTALFMASFMVKPIYTSALRIIALVVVLQMVFLYYFCLLRADIRFNLVSKGTAALSIFSTTLVILLSYFSDDKLWGALCGILAAYPFVIIYWFYKGGYRFTARLKWAQVKDSFGVGFPLIMLGLINMVLMSLDRWVIAWQLPAVALGFYALGIMVSNMLGMVPYTVANVLFPRMLESFATTQDYVAVSGLMLNPLRAMAVMMIFLISATTIFVPVVIGTLLPKYIPAIPLIEILVPGAYFLAIAPIAGNYVVAIDHQRRLIVLQLVAVGICLVLYSIFLYAGYGIRGIAYGTIVCYAVYGLGNVGVAVYLALGRWREALQFLIHMVTLFGVMLISLKVTNFYLPGVSPWKDQLFYSFVRLFIVIIFLLPTIWLCNRKSGMLSSVWMAVKSLLAAKSKSI